MDEAIFMTDDGTIDHVSNTAPTLEEAQKFIGGYVEITTPIADKQCQMLMDEDGLRKRLPVNIKATMLYVHRSIVGNVILLYGKCRWK